MAEKMIIPVTFKEDEEWLYKKICSHSSHSGFIKDTLKKALSQEQEEPKELPKNTSDVSSIFNGIGISLK